MNLEDNELRQAIAAMESYKERVEALSRQVQVLRVSLEEVTMSADALKAFKNAKEGDEIMVPVGASSFITVKVTSNRNVVVGIGSNISVEKDIDDAIGYMDANNAEIAEALKKSAEALNEAQQALTTISNAVQQEYVNRQQAAQGIQ
ncbi:MAG: prefoldin subunit alpha [Candidatus Methanomethylophilaceae archaeon]